MRCTLVALLTAATVSSARADDAIERYRRSWNPFSAGPQLVSSADLHPQGQAFVRPYLYSEFGYGHFTDWSIRPQPLAQKLAVINPQVEVNYGLLDALEVGTYVSYLAWWLSDGGGKPGTSGNGIGDTTPFLKWRFLVQDPDSWEPSLTLATFVALPSSDWFGTPSVPGGFPPLGKLPATHLGALELTEALLFRKNLRPFRLSGGFYYSYGLPGSGPTGRLYYGDIFQYRLSAEHFLDDRRGFAYALEVLGLHGLPFRLDGKPVNAGQPSFGLLGVQPTVEYRLTDQLVGAAGVLFTLAGYHEIAAVYPNLSVYYYFGNGGKIVAR
jgi:hypothetical protein